MVSAFRCLYYSAHGLSLLLPLLYATVALHGVSLPPLLTVAAVLVLLTLPRLLALNTALHRGIAHGAFTVGSCPALAPAASLSCHLLSSLSLLPYSPATWAQRHQHFHSLSPIPQPPPSTASPAPHAADAAKPPSEGDAAEEEEEDVLGLSAQLPSLPRSLLALWQLWPSEDDVALEMPQAGEPHMADGLRHGMALLQRLPLAPALAANAVAATLLHSLLSPPSSSSSPASLALSALLVASLLACSQVWLWLCSALLLNHALAFPFVGYQLHRLPHHNSLLVSLLTAGGGYLNSHHAAPSAPFHGRLPYELDPNAGILRLLSSLGLVHLPTSPYPPPPPSLAPRLQLLTGEVSHTRMWPFYHRFRYPVSFVRSPVSADAGAALDPYWLFSARPQRRWWEGALAPVRLRPGDYLSVSRVLRLLEGAGAELPSDAAHRRRLRVELVTCWRYLGYGMNPISYYLCYDADGQRLLGMVSEVTNTPWGEVVHYAHPAQERGRWLVDEQAKALHVSPFMSMAYSYHLRYTRPSDTWTVHWAMQHTHRNQHAPHHSTVRTLALSQRHPLHEPPPLEGEEGEGEGVKGSGEGAGVEGRHFKAFLELQCRDVTQLRLLRNCVQYPLQSVRVVVWIYYQAAVLFLSRHAAYYVHPQQLQTLKAAV